MIGWEMQNRKVAALIQERACPPSATEARYPSTFVRTCGRILPRLWQSNEGSSERMNVRATAKSNAGMGSLLKNLGHCSVPATERRESTSEAATALWSENEGGEERDLCPDRPRKLSQSGGRKIYTLGWRTETRRWREPKSLERRRYFTFSFGSWLVQSRRRFNRCSNMVHRQRDANELPPFF